MSGAALGWAKAQRAPTVTAKAVLVCLADYCDQDGLAWPSIGRLAEEVQISERTVQRAMRGLEEAGLITREEHSRQDGGQTSNRYHLSIPPRQSVAPPGDTSDTPPVTTVSPPYEPPFDPKASEEAMPPPEKAATVYPPLFEAAWKAYRHVKGRSSKPKTLAAWRRLQGIDRAGLPDAAGRYAKEGREPNADCGAPAMDRWLTAGRYLDWLPTVEPPKTYTAAARTQQLAHFRATGEWRSEWGDQPEEQAA